MREVVSVQQGRKMGLSAGCARVNKDPRQACASKCQEWGAEAWATCRQLHDALAHSHQSHDARWYSVIPSILPCSCSVILVTLDHQVRHLGINTEIAKCILGYIGMESSPEHNEYHFTCPRLMPDSIRQPAPLFSQFFEVGTAPTLPAAQPS